MKRLGPASAIALSSLLGATLAGVVRAEELLEGTASSDAPAQYPSIHLAVSPPDSPVVPLLRAELDELGLTVVDGPTGGASITVHTVLARDSLEVRISDDRTGETILREAFSIGNGRAMDPRTAVLHASELLRWHLHYRPRTPPPGVTRAPPALVAVPTAAAEERSRFRFGVLPLAIYSPGGTQLGLGAELEAARRWSWFELRVLGATSLVPNRMSVAEGQLEARSAWAGVEGAFVWEPGHGGTGVELGLGGALFSSALRGAADGAYTGRDDRLLTVAPFLELRVQQRITRGFSLVLSTQCLLPQEALRLRVVDREVGTYGRQVLTLGLGPQLTLF